MAGTHRNPYRDQVSDSFMIVLARWAGWEVPSGRRRQRRELTLSASHSFPPLFGHEVVLLVVGLIWGLWMVRLQRLH